MGIDYAWEKLSTAVSYAIQHQGTLQDRLIGCYQSFHVLSQKGALPPDLQARFDKMIDAWSRLPDPIGIEGTVAVTLKQMDDAEARKWLEEILFLFERVAQRYER